MIMAKDSNNNYVKIEDIKQQNSFNGISPIEFKGSGKNLENYRIYGNTISGESVGDKTDNLWNVEIVDNYSSYSNGKISPYAGRCTNIEPIVVDGNSYTLSYSSPLNATCIVMIKNSGELISRVFKSGSIIMIDTSGGNELYITWIINDTTSITSDMIQDIMLNIGSTPLPYEPCGYRVPVTVEGKNLFQTTTSSQTKNGVTFTVNNDGSVICNGTASKDTFFKIGDLPLASQSYILTGCPSDGGNDSYMLRCYKNGNIKGGDVGNGFNINDSIDGYGYIEIRIASGYTCDNLTFYPMIRKANIEDDTYEPYHDPINTNIYLPEPLRMVGEETEYVDYEERKQHRVRKNLLQNTAINRTLSTGITITVNDNKSVVINGTSTIGKAVGIVLGGNVILDKGAYILSGCPQGGSNDTYKLICIFDDDGERKVLSDNGNGATIVLNGDNPKVIDNGFYIHALSCDNNVFFPMLRKASIEDDTYEPYIEDTELNVTLPALPTLFGTNILSVNTNTKPSKVWGKLSDLRDILYVKDSQGNILFSKYHEISINGSPPLTYKAKKWGNLSNYLICGNTVDGESVGDKTDNIIRDYAVARTQAQYAAVLFIDTELIPNTTYSFTCLLNSSELRLYVNESLFNTISYVKDDVVLKIIVKTLSELPDSQKINGKWIMLKNSITEPVVPELSNIMMIKGSEMPAIYEPYGYRVPVTVSNGTDTKTTNLYLPEKIKMVGDEPEYIDFGAQKHYRVRKNLLNEEYIQGNPISDSIIRVKCKTPIPLVKGELYTISFDSGSLFDVSLGSSPTPKYPFAADTTILSSCGNSLNWLTSPYTFECVNDGYISVTIRKKDNTSITPDEVNFAIQFEKNSTATSYEPYIEDTELNVTLPALPTISGTNTLTVGTEVQPSQVYIKGKIKGKIYGWHVNPDISDSSNAVTYLKDAIGMTPASMGSTTFDYGSWENAFFMPKPCMLKSNGKVDYYLDPNDYTKKLNGTASDISNPNYDGNAMMQWPKIWFKYVKGVKEGQGYFYVANYKADGNFHCWCNYDSEDNEIDHFYTAIYNGTSFANYSSSKTYVINDFAIYDNKLYKCNTDIATAESFDNTKWDLVSNTAPVINKMRSLSGVRLTNNNGNAQTNTTTEVTRATANNTTSAAEWYIETFSDRLLINGLLVLMGKSLNTQAVFGRGLDTGGQSAKEAYVTGALNNKGLFWGVTENGNSGVKVFGMENFWGCYWHRTAGLITNNHAVKLKLTYGTKDGSTVIGYNQTGNGYIDNGTAPYSNGYVQKMSYNKYGFMPAVVTGGSQSTYYADYHHQNANSTGTMYALFGGFSRNDFRTGAFYLALNNAPESAGWTLAASLSCKPLLN